ncbi:MAG: hypothetical protein HN952_01645 [Candidatus Cloacimonetes bacterium]|jgi:hypothetical protein|nr:hypothetical protein [Candidatus Cloacimonadota bacterium]MBT6993638.1 hypothetical protein [Candidatus Cloacimonadota bacterium]MBT7470093.1 hypothetical protein [Candidatus Cloacimonadota bacterium]
MKNKEKKLKAAILGVLKFIQRNKQKKENLWAKSGRKMAMKNREMVQRRGSRY